MPKRHGAAYVCSTVLLMLGSGLACGQSASGRAYPTKPVRIVTAEPGGGADFVARILAQNLTDSLGQQVIVDNRGGANGVRIVQAVAQASPDGYTLLLLSATLWMSPLLQGAKPFDPDKDFAAITVADRSPNILVVTPSLPANSVKELIALAKAKPGTLNYSSASTGSSTHLSGELFKSMAGVNIVRVFYKSGSTEILDLISGQVQLSFGSASSMLPHVKSGKLKGLAVTSLRSSALTPNLPTVAASGLPGYETGAIHTVFATANTPVAIINRLNQEMVRALNHGEVKARLLNAGIESVGSSPAELVATVKSDLIKWKKVIEDAGIRVE